VKTLDEIKKYADTKDRPCLLWLFKRYHMESQWHFVAQCAHVRYGVESDATHRRWYPTPEGLTLYHMGTREPVGMVSHPPLKTGSDRDACGIIHFGTRIWNLRDKTLIYADTT